MASERTTHRALTVAGLILALAMAALESTVVATAMPTVIGDLGGIHQYAWVTTAYLLTSSVLVPICGKLSDIYGRKPIMLFGIAVFLLGSIASGAARSMPQLIAFRALQGAGAGAMQPMAMTISGDIFDLKERARIQGVFGAAWGLFGIIGPMVGGLIVHYFSWRWVFYINIPFGAASVALVATSFHERIDRRPHELDFLGAALLTAGVVALLLATGRLGGETTLLAAVASAALFAVFFAVERRAPEPMIPLPLFRRPVMFISNVAGAILGGAMMGTITFVPLFVQGVLRGSPTDAGSAIAPMLIGWPIASAIGGRLIPRVGFRPLIWIGLGVTAAAGLALALGGTHDTPLMLRATTLVFGVGMGLSNVALLIAVQSSVAWEQRGIATASTMFSRLLGGVVAVGIMGGVLTAQLAKDPSIPADAASRLLTAEGARGLDPSIVQHLGEALTSGLTTVFWIIAAMGITGFIAALWFPRVPIEAAGGDAAVGPPSEAGIG
ncbi:MULTISPECIES: MDR family MFS transporter [Sorangium]|uniref:MDR family MFS transporter n=1 Tax=Sorangium atrum TaxID=2995308 RepID=A0ABT5CBI3_9BACT|nr:MDR family MFS transporter [Sorangium aterium]MDC0683003.1 MDR family MFS transporter [Sorangium aterium]